MLSKQTTRCSKATALSLAADAMGSLIAGRAQSGAADGLPCAHHEVCSCSFSKRDSVLG